tara:strand:- start:579 stop:797 length:219 start_codon:yes stop_codon:yes gene_type:complete
MKKYPTPAPLEWTIDDAKEVASLCGVKTQMTEDEWYRVISKAANAASEEIGEVMRDAIETVLYFESDPVDLP